MKKIFKKGTMLQLCEKVIFYPYLYCWELIMKPWTAKRYVCLGRSKTTGISWLKLTFFNQQTIMWLHYTRFFLNAAKQTCHSQENHSFHNTCQQFQLQWTDTQECCVFPDLAMFSLYGLEQNFESIFLDKSE